MIVWQTYSTSNIQNITELFLEEEGMTSDDVVDEI